MKINWKLRVINKTTLIAIAVSVIALVYQVLNIIGIVPLIAESEIVNVAGMVINLLALLGIIADPTTDGISDSTQVLTYEYPRKDKGV